MGRRKKNIFCSGALEPEPKLLITILASKIISAELGTRQFFLFRDNVLEPQGPENVRKIFRSRCLNGVATTIAIRNH